MNKFKHLSFGFGSNTNLVELQSKLPSDSVKLVCRAWCVGYEPLYRYYSSGRNGGALDIKNADNSMLTPGAIVQLTDEGLRVLDSKEGVNCEHSYYDRKAVPVLTEDGDLKFVETYLVNPNRYEVSHQPPHQDYRRVVSNGMRALGQSIQPFEEAADNLPIKTPVNKFFVYGTLKQGESRGNVLSECGITSRTVARAPGLLFDLGSYPGMAKAKTASDWVLGELITVENPEKAVRIADDIEGFNGFSCSDNLFNRRLISVTNDHGDSDVAWVYYASDVVDGTLLTSGYWGSKPKFKLTAIADLYHDEPDGESDDYSWSISECLHKSDDMRSMLRDLTAGSLSDQHAFAYARQLLDAQRKGNKQSCFYGAWRIIPGDDPLPADARVDFVYTPTYLAIAFLCRLSLEYCDAHEQVPELDETLNRAYKFAVGRNLSGAGYECVSGTLDALTILKQGRVAEVLVDSECQESKVLAQLIRSKEQHFFERVCLGDTASNWGDNEIEEPLVALFS